MSRKSKTPQYKGKVVDIRVAAAKRWSILFLNELGIAHDPQNALTIVRDILTLYDPTNPQRNHENIEKVLSRYQILQSLIPRLKQQGII